MFWHHSKEPRLYRAWWHYGEHGRHCSSIEVSWGRPSFHLSCGIDDEHGYKASFAVPLLAVYLHVGLPWPRISISRDISIRVHDWALWWTIWRDPMGGWSRDVPRWREGSFHSLDALLGRTKCTTKVLEVRAVTIPMPERAYHAKAELVEYTWKRPRWLAKSRNRVQIDIPGGIPHAGKGENSWDCGDDATFGMTTGECRSIPEGIGILVGSVLSSRVRYGGWGDYLWTREAA